LTGQFAGEMAGFPMVSFLLIIMMPTLSILTLAPFMETRLKIPQLGKETFIGSIIMTLAILYFMISAVELYGPLPVFLPFDEIMPFFIAMWLFFLEMLVITATIMGAVVLGFCPAKKSQVQLPCLLIASCLLITSLFLIQPLFIGFLALFICIALEKVPWPGARMGMPLLLAFAFIGAMSYGVSVAKFTFLLQFYNISLINLGIAAPAMVTLFPIVDHYRKGFNTEIAVVLSSSITFVLLYSLSTRGHNLMDAFNGGLSMLPLNTRLLIEGSYGEVFVAQAVFVMLGAVVSGAIYGLIVSSMKGRKKSLTAGR
jgi:hypothetical protein